MKKYLIFFLVFLLAVLQASFLKLNLVLLLVLLWATFRSDQEGLMIAFFSGLLLDLASGTPLGLSSLIFVLSSFLIILYRRRFDPSHFAFLPIFTFFSLILFDALIKGRLYWLNIFTVVLLAVLSRFLFTPFFEELGRSRHLKI